MYWSYKPPWLPVTFLRKTGLLTSLHEITLVPNFSIRILSVLTTDFLSLRSARSLPVSHLFSYLLAFLYQSHYRLLGNSTIYFPLYSWFTVRLEVFNSADLRTCDLSHLPASQSWWTYTFTHVSCSLQLTQSQSHPVYTLCTRSLCFIARFNKGQHFRKYPTQMVLLFLQHNSSTTWSQLAPYALFHRPWIWKCYGTLVFNIDNFDSGIIQPSTLDHRTGLKLGQGPMAGTWTPLLCH